MGDRLLEDLFTFDVVDVTIKPLHLHQTASNLLTEHHFFKLFVLSADRNHLLLGVVTVFISDQHSTVSHTVF